MGGTWLPGLGSAEVVNGGARGSLMREAFRGYYKPTDEELRQIWDAGDLILDTNALLNLFRYTKETRIAFFGALTERNSSLWIPNEVGVEFHRNRLGVVLEQGEPFDKLDAVVRSTRETVDKILSDYRNKEHPSLDGDAISSVWAKALRSVEKEMSTARERHRDYGGVVEEIFESIATLYANKVGAPYAKDALAKLHEEAEARYADKVPPGYKDADKPVPRKYGDFIIWKQILDRAGEQKRPAIFVTDDGKEDWWDREKGQTRGPRPELIEEFYDRTGCRIHFYSPKRFLEFANPSVSTEALNEVEQVSTDRETRYRNRNRYRLRDRDVVVKSLLSDRAQSEGSLRKVIEDLEQTRSSAAHVDELAHRLEQLNLLVRSHERHGFDESRLSVLVDERDMVMVELDALRAEAVKKQWLVEQVEQLQSRIARLNHEIQRASVTNVYAIEDADTLDSDHLANEDG
jgi:hypothetical protein